MAHGLGFGVWLGVCFRFGHISVGLSANSGARSGVWGCAWLGVRC